MQCTSGQMSKVYIYNRIHSGQQCENCPGAVLNGHDNGCGDMTSNDDIKDMCILVLHKQRH